MKTVEKAANKLLDYIRHKRFCRMNKAILTFAFSSLILSVNNAQASNQCGLAKSDLVSEVVNLCLSYQDIESIEEYENKTKSINNKRKEYISCTKNYETLDIHASSLYVLSEIKFFVRLRNKWAENPVAWLAVEKTVSNAVREKCGQFISEALGSDR